MSAVDRTPRASSSTDSSPLSSASARIIPAMVASVPEPFNEIVYFPPRLALQRIVHGRFLLAFDTGPSRASARKTPT